MMKSETKVTFTLTDKQGRGLVGLISEKIEHRLTALEEQPKAEYFEKLFLDLAHRITALETLHDLNKGDCTTDIHAIEIHPHLEAKVNAPVKFTSCWDCTYDPVCTLADRLLRGCSNGLRKQKQPPNTCGNCAKAWRWDGISGAVLCRWRLEGKYEIWASDRPGCADHERREA